MEFIVYCWPKGGPDVAVIRERFELSRLAHGYVIFSADQESFVDGELQAKGFARVRGEAAEVLRTHFGLLAADTETA